MIPKIETIHGQQIRCYDNGGASIDRYTVVYLNEPEGKSGFFACVGMNSEPFHPQGFGQHSTAMDGPHHGKRIAFATLPPDCQKLVLRDLTPEGAASHTPGPWTVRQAYDNGEPSCLVVHSGANNICDVYPGERITAATEIAEANARLIAEAGTVASETGLTPRQLAEQRAELRELLADVGQWLEIGLSRGEINRGTANRDSDLVSQIRAALAKSRP